MTRLHRLLLSITAGAILGGWLRFLFERINPLATDFPVDTLAANVLGSFTIGLAALRRRPDTGVDPFHVLRHGVVVGFCGGLTTFSFLSLQLFERLAEGRAAEAVLYALLTLSCCLAGVWAGVKCPRPWRKDSSTGANQ